jgi:hypothetical protein
VNTIKLLVGVPNNPRLRKCVQALVGAVRSHAHGFHPWIDSPGALDGVQPSLFGSV